ncbi:MAG: EAL domain-containing protein [Treponema sp.]|nr:EAL domain-containing protein [Treponema sp.]
MLKSIMRWIYQYDVAALFISLVILFNLFVSQRIKTRVSKAFKILAIDLFLATVFDIITIYTISYYEQCPIWLNYVLNIIALLTYNSLPVFYIISIMYGSMSEDQDFTIAQKLFLAIPVCAAGFLIATTPVTKAIIYFTADGQYKIGSTFDILTGIGFVYLIMVIVWGVMKRKVLRTEQTITIIVYTVTTIAALIICNIWTRLLVTLFFASLSVLITYLSLDNPSEYTDPIMDVYNKKAFMFTTNDYFNSRKSFTVLGIQIEGISYLNETLGYNNFNKILVKIARKICGICGKNNVYRLSGSKIAVIIHSDDKNKDDKFLELQLLFSQSIKIAEIEVSPKVKMATFQCPEAADNFVKLNDLIFDTLNSSEIESGKIVDGNKKMLEKSRREYELIRILKQALTQNEFEVFYQPIYSVKKKKFTTAEALIRLNNEELGFVSPEEFIPVAERNGLILLIGEFVFRSVCKFIINNKLWEKGIEYIHVNLSAIQCMQEKLHEQLLEIMNFYKLDYKYIELEVTETAAIASSDTLLKNMRSLMENNMNFALDDYGMGYSNTSTILQYPFHTIKLDKSIVWAAMKNEKAQKLLHHTIAMFRDMGIELVAEGVETSEMAVMLMKMKCDYLQGFLYSKPVTGRAFLDLLEHKY